MKQEILEEIKNSQKSLIISGEVASGKTTNIAFPLVEEMINKKESMFILDSKEEYINNYYDLLKKNDYNIVVLNLRDLGKSENWNPLDYPYSLYKNGDKDRAQEYVEKIGKTIFYDNTSSDPFWSISASDFFTGITLALFEDGKKDEINLNSINNMFNGIDSKCGISDYISVYFGLKPKTSPAYVFASTTFMAPFETKASIISVAKQQLRSFTSKEKLSQLLNSTSFDLNELLKKPTCIVLINKDEDKSNNAIAALFIEQLYNILLDNKQTSKFNFVLDNLDSIEMINGLDSMIGSGTSRGIKFILTTRSFDELIQKYGKYITTLCDKANINNNKLEISLNSKNVIEEKNFNTVTIPNSDIEYPKLSETEIKYFDIEKFVNSKVDVKKTETDSIIEQLKKVSGSSDFDKLMKELDDRIKELEDKL